MSDVTERFFDELAERDNEPVLAGINGRVRFDIVGKRTEHWLVTIDRGEITVTHENGAADCTMKADREVFDRLVVGDDNAMAATLRGALVCSGEVDLLLAIQKLFPGRDLGRHEHVSG
jgi:putative sterol carrier protein